MRRAGHKGLRGYLAGRLVGVGGAQGRAGLPLACGQGMASMFEPEGRVAQPPVLDEHAQSSPAEGRTDNIEAQPDTPSDPAPRCHDKAQKTSAKQKKETPIKERSPSFATLTSPSGWPVKVKAKAGSNDHLPSFSSFLTSLTPGTAEVASMAC